MTRVRIGEPVTVIDRTEFETWHAVADTLVRGGQQRLLCGRVSGHNARALVPEREGITWCRGHVIGEAAAALRAAFLLWKSGR